MRIGTMQQALTTRRRPAGVPTYRSDIIPDDGPAWARIGNAKLIEQDPGSELGAHFHFVNQFQVVVGGSGTIGRRDVAPWTVQFAGPSTPYGPLTAGPDGLSYLVIRNAINHGIAYMPAERARMGPESRRYHITAPFQDSTTPEAAGPISEQPMLADEPDGLAATHLRLPPNASTAQPAPANCGGQVLVLLSGAASLHGAALDPLSCIFAAPGEDMPELTAGPDGAELLRLRFPTTGIGEAPATPTDKS